MRRTVAAPSFTSVMPSSRSAGELSVAGRSREGAAFRPLKQPGRMLSRRDAGRRSPQRRRAPSRTAAARRDGRRCRADRGCRETRTANRSIRHKNAATAIVPARPNSTAWTPSSAPDDCRHSRPKAISRGNRSVVDGCFHEQTLRYVLDSKDTPSARDQLAVVSIEESELTAPPLNHRNRKNACLTARSTWLSASELTTLYARRELSPVDVVDAMLVRAATLQPHLNAFVLIDDDGRARRGQGLGGALAEGRAAVAARRRADHDQGHDAGQGLADALRLACHRRDAGRRERARRRQAAGRRHGPARQDARRRSSAGRR